MIYSATQPISTKKAVRWWEKLAKKERDKETRKKYKRIAKDIKNGKK